MVITIGCHWGRNGFYFLMTCEAHYSYSSVGTNARRRPQRLVEHTEMQSSRLHSFWEYAYYVSMFCKCFAVMNGIYPFLTKSTFDHWAYRDASCVHYWPNYDCTHNYRKSRIWSQLISFRFSSFPRRNAVKSSPHRWWWGYTRFRDRETPHVWHSEDDTHWVIVQRHQTKCMHTWNISHINLHQNSTSYIAYNVMCSRTDSDHLMQWNSDAL